MSCESRLFEPSPRPALGPVSVPLRRSRPTVPRCFCIGFLLLNCAPLQSSFAEASLAHFRARDLCLGSGPSSRHHRGCPLATKVAKPPLRSVLRCSQPLDGLLHHPALQVYFIPQPRPGRTCSGDSLSAQRTSSSEVHPAPLPLAHRALGNRSCRPCSAGLDFEALIRVEQRALASGYSPQTSFAPLFRFSLLQVLSSPPFQLPGYVHS